MNSQGGAADSADVRAVCVRLRFLHLQLSHYQIPKRASSHDTAFVSWVLRALGENIRWVEAFTGRTKSPRHKSVPWLPAPSSVAPILRAVSTRWLLLVVPGFHNPFLTMARIPMEASDTSTM